jgi:OTU domain-containing protein 6
VAANYIRQHSSDFTPYLEMTAEDPAFEEYCRKVESDVDAEWGGQLEVTALAAALHTQIAIYSADSPVLVMGEGENSSADASSHPIRISYHRHYFALGEHYNSIVPTKSVTVN